MSLATWSWITAAVSILGSCISGWSPRWGWAYGIGAQIVWVTAGLVTGQPGTVALSVVFIGLDILYLWRWRGTNFTPVAKHNHRQIQCRKQKVGP